MNVRMKRFLPKLSTITEAVCPALCPSCGRKSSTRWCLRTLTPSWPCLCTVFDEPIPRIESNKDTGDDDNLDIFSQIRTIKKTVPDNLPDNGPNDQELTSKQHKTDPLRKTKTHVQTKPTPTTKTANERAKQRERVKKCRANKALKEEASSQRKQFLIQDNNQLETNINSLNMQYQQLMEILMAHKNAQPNIDVHQLIN